jgi:16S rRNA (guanine1207-N2)-methyltransferase
MPMPPEPPNLPPIRPAEERALAAARHVGGNRILCTTLGRAQAAVQLARDRPQGCVACWFIDEHQGQLAAESHAAAGAPSNLELYCQADPPEATIDLAVIPLSMRGEAEFTREVLQAACLRLEIGGTLIAAVDNPRDQWVREQLAGLFTKVTVQPHDDTVVYIARKTTEPRKVRDFTCRFTYRDRERLIHAVSRPGVFAHRRVDPGARQLLAAAEVAPGTRVLDIGCGAGTVAIALAVRDASARVHAVDGNARAVECTLAGAALNDLPNITAELNSTGHYRDAAPYDLAVANPPYYADYRIAELFLGAAHRALRPGGRVLIVAKQTQWYEDFMPATWSNVEHHPSKRYHIITATRPVSPRSLTGG